MNRRGFISLAAVGAATAKPTPGTKPAAAAASPTPLGMKLGCQSGPITDRRLEFFKRHGVANICGLFEKSDARAFTVEELSRQRDQCAKHGVSLSEADGVLLDPLAITVEDSSAEGEERYVTIGMNSFGSLMVVVWTERETDVRLISARKAEPKERRSYEERI